MLVIQKMKATLEGAMALVSDGEKEYVVNLLLPEKQQLQVISGEDVIEQYPYLEAGIYSRFAEVFLALRRAVNSCQVIYKEDLSEGLASRKSFAQSGEAYSARNEFSLYGEAYSADITYDLSPEIPRFSFVITKGETVVEWYDALYQALDSEYYYVLADLDNDLKQKLAEGGKI